MLLISCFALRSIPPGFPTGTILREWPGEVKPGQVHPSWSGPASRLRNGTTGRILPALLLDLGVKGGPENAGGIVAVGFSAGVQGIRELLRHPADRALIDGVVIADGLHPTIAADPNAETGPFADWDRQMAPFAAYADRAVFSASGAPSCMVATATDIAAPAPSVAPSAIGLAGLVEDVASRGQRLPNLWPQWPLRASSPTPIDSFRSGDFSAFWYAGTQAADHVAQARDVIPDALIAFILPCITGVEVIPVGFTQPGSAASSSGAPLTVRPSGVGPFVVAGAAAATLATVVALS